MIEKKSGMGSCWNGGNIRIMKRKGTARYSHVDPLCNIGLTTGGEKRYREIIFSNGSSHKTIQILRPTENRIQPRHGDT